MRWIRAIGRNGGRWVRPADLRCVGIRYGQDNRCDVIGVTKYDVLTLLSTFNESNARALVESL